MTESNEIAIPLLWAAAIKTSRLPLKLDQDSASEMLATLDPNVVVLGLAIKRSGKVLTAEQCISVINENIHEHARSMAFLYLGEIAYGTEREDLTSLCFKFLHDPTQPEGLRVSAYKAILYIWDRSLHTQRLMFEINSLRDIEWGLIDDLSPQSELPPGSGPSTE